MKRSSAVLALLLVGLIVVNGVMFLKARGDTSRDDAGVAAVSAARTAVAKIFTYSPADVDHYADRSLPLTTGKFNQELTSMIGKQIVPDTHNKQTAIHTTVEGAAILSASPDEATVLVFADQWRSDQSSSTPVLNAVRLQVTMRSAHGRWLVSALHAL